MKLVIQEYTRCLENYIALFPGSNRLKMAIL